MLLPPYHQSLLSRFPDDTFVQLTLGAAHNCLSDSSTPKFTLGACLAGPLFFPYVYWVLQQARSQGIHTLYFIARDGYVLKEIADIIIQGDHLSVSTRYLYGSRKAWRIPAYAGGNEFCFESFFAPAVSPTPAALSQNLELSFAELSGFLPRSYRRANRHLSERDLQDLREVIFADPRFTQLLRERSLQLKTTVLDYLRQEIFTSPADGKIAFVELCGSGATQDCLATLLKELCPESIPTFYLAFTHNRPTPGSPKYALFTPPYCNDLLESLARAPHGQTLGYRRHQDKIIPVLEDSEGTTILANGFADTLAGIKAFAANYVRLIHSHSLNPVNPRIFDAYVNYLLHSPDRQTAALVGSTPFNTNPSDTSLGQLAPPLGFGNVLFATLSNRMLPTRWFAGSLVRSGFFSRQLMRFKPKINRFFHVLPFPR